MWLICVLMSAVHVCNLMSLEFEGNKRNAKRLLFSDGR